VRHPLILPPGHKRLGVREHTRPACRFDRLSSARASVLHRRNEVGFLPARASQAPTSEGLHARGTFAEPSSTQARMLLYRIAAPAGRAQAISLVRRQNLISKNHSRTLARPLADHLFNKRLFLTALNATRPRHGAIVKATVTFVPQTGFERERSMLERQD